MKKARPGDPLRAVGYVRASTEDQKLTPEAQRETIERFARDRGIVVVAWFEDLGISGAAPIEKRPGMLAAMDALLEQRAGVLLVVRRDRLARDKGIAWTLDLLAEKNGARIISADGSDIEGPSGELLRTMLDAFAEFERALISTRTRAALEQRKNAGKKSTSAPPYGFRERADGQLEIDPQEKRAVQYIRAMRERGKSYEQIAQLCTKRGYFNRKGRPFAPTSIVRILKRGTVVRAGCIMSTREDTRENMGVRRSSATTSAA